MENPVKSLNRNAMVKTIYVMVAANVLNILIIIFAGIEIPFILIILVPWSYLYFLHIDKKQRETNDLLNWDPKARLK